MIIRIRAACVAAFAAVALAACQTPPPANDGAVAAPVEEFSGPGVGYEPGRAIGGFIPSVYFDSDPDSPCAADKQLSGPDDADEGYTCLEVFFGTNRKLGSASPTPLSAYGDYPVDPAKFFRDERWPLERKEAGFYRAFIPGEGFAPYETYATGRAFVTVPKRQPGDKLIPFEYKKPLFGRTRTPNDDDRKELFTLAQYELLPGAEFWRLAGEMKQLSQLGVSSGEAPDWVHDAGAVLVYVHGFNVGFDGAAYRTAQLAYDLRFAGVPLFFSWPANSTGNSLAYFNDSSEAAASVGDLKLFLRDVDQKLSPTKYILVAHSHGNQIVLDALNELATENETGGPIFDAVIFASPDVDALEFKRVAERVGPVATSKTLYASQEDRAIWVRQLLTRRRVPLFGKKLEEKPRAGHVPRGGRPLAIDGVDVIDVTEACVGSFGPDEEPDKLGHSKYADARDLVSDMRGIIDSLWSVPFAAPEERSPKMRPAPPAAPAYWRFENEPNAPDCDPRRRRR
ncbi:MAG: alpha/beta hydrolase [Parvularculaceae bacterium]